MALDWANPASSAQRLRRKEETIDGKLTGKHQRIMENEYQVPLFGWHPILPYYLLLPRPNVTFYQLGTMPQAQLKSIVWFLKALRWLWVWRALGYGGYAKIWVDVGGLIQKGGSKF